MPLSRATRSQLRADEAPRGRASAATTATITDAPAKRETSSGDEAVTAVVARAAQDDDRAAAPSAEVRGKGADGRGDGGPGMLHQPQLGIAECLRAPVGAGHRLG